MVTTPLPETWDTKKPLLMLGKWCTLHPKISKIKNKFLVRKKHYSSDAIVLYRNYLYASKLYERLLRDLTKTLNKYHGVKFTVKYWRITLGPWLMYFLHIVYDRWNALKQIDFKKDISKTCILNVNDIDLTPVDLEDFNAFWLNDVWNHFIFSKILKEIAPKKIIVKRNFKFRGIKPLIAVMPENKFPFYKNQKIFICKETRK